MKEKVIYTPNKYAMMSFFKLLIIMFQDFKKAASLGWRLFLRDYSTKYKQHAFGILWVLINPIIAIVPFILLAKAAVLKIEGISAPYPIYAFLGIIIWGTFQSVTISVASTLNSNSGLISKINFPKESLLISPLFTACIDFLIKLLIFFFLCFIYDYSLSITNILYILAVFPVIVLGLGLGMFLTVIGVIFKDIAIILGYFFQFVMLATPILYTKPKVSILAKLTAYNPFYYLVTIPRDLVLTGTSEILNIYIFYSLGSLIFLIMGWRFFKVATARIIERV